MANYLPKRDAIDRRALLLGTAGALAAVTASAIERPNTGMQFAAKTVSTSEAPNLHPPVVQVNGGKLRGLKDGRVFTFLGIPYAPVEWFEIPQAVPAWDGIKGAQRWGGDRPGTGPVLCHFLTVSGPDFGVVQPWSRSRALLCR